jgi:Eukaryotic aspartyl protease
MSKLQQSAQTFWTTTLDSIVVGEKHIVLSRNASSAIMDTGTSVIVGHENDVKEIYAQIPGSEPAGSKDDLGEGYFTSMSSCRSASPGY